MSITNLEHVLLWCFAINYVILIWWWVLMLLPHRWLYKLCRCFRVSDEKFDEMNLLGIIGYKVVIIFFTLIPYVALRIVRG